MSAEDAFTKTGKYNFSHQLSNFDAIMSCIEGLELLSLVLMSFSHACIVVCLFVERARSKKKAFTRYAELWGKPDGKNVIEENLKRMKKYCKVIRAICHTQTNLIGLRQKKAHVMEIQINGGTPAEKVGFSKFQDVIYVIGVLLSLVISYVGGLGSGTF